MANFSPSNLVKAQVQLTEQFKKQEMREQQLPALRLALNNADILIPSAETVRTREDRAVEAYVLARSKRATTSSRTYNHSGSRGDSFAVPLTWNTYTDKFSISLKQMDNNMFGFEATFRQQMLNCILNIHASIEADNIAYLLAQRTQINQAVSRGTYNTVNHAFEIAQIDSKQFYQIAENMMAENFYMPMYDAIASPSNYIDAQFYVNQGAGNAQNTSFQFGNVNIVRSTNLTDANYPGGVSLIMPAASFANLPWIPKQNRQGWGDFNSYVGGYGSFQDPTGLPLTYAVHGYAQRADASGANGDTQDVVMEFELSVDIAKQLSPLSVATESVVYEVAQLQ